MTNGPTLRWDLDDASGTAIVDSSGAGNTGTVSSATWGDGVDACPLCRVSRFARPPQATATPATSSGSSSGS